MTATEVLHPLGLDVFTSRYIGSEWLRLLGTAGRFADLATWQQITNFINTHRVAGSRLRLVKHGVDVERSRFVLAPNTDAGSPLRVAGLVQELRAGATMVLDAVDEFLPDVRTLAEELEDLVRTDIKVNMYAGWGADNGFALHWDDHDTLILQLAGRKSWRVFEPTRRHPLRGDIFGKPDEKTSPIWAGTLNDGDVLYLPRGWWHVAYPMNEPSLHLTFGVGHPTGVDFLTWVIREMRDDLAVRSDLPHLASDDVKDDYARHLREALSERLCGRTVTDFARWRDGQMRLRQRVTLPDDVVRDDSTLRDEDILRLSRNRVLHINSESRNGRASFAASGTTWTCESTLLPALTLLRRNEGVSLQALKYSIPDCDRGALHVLLAAMIAGGAIIRSSC